MNGSNGWGSWTGQAAKERYRHMRKYTTLILAVGALLALAVAGIANADKPTVVRAGNLIFTIDGNVKPTALPKNKMAPITLNISGKIASADGSHVPALKEVIVDTDKNGTINPKGLKACKSGQLQAQDTKHAEAICKASIIGEGTTTAEVAFPEQRPILVPSKLLAFNGGTAGGTTTIYIHAFFTAPITGALVTTVKIKKQNKGRYGLRSVASVPVLAGGNGSIRDFKLKFFKTFTYKGKKQSYFLAQCKDGKFVANAKSVFRDGSSIEGGVTRTCTPKG